MSKLSNCGPNYCSGCPVLEVGGTERLDAENAVILLKGLISDSRDERFNPVQRHQLEVIAGGLVRSTNPKIGAAAVRAVETKLGRRCDNERKDNNGEDI